MEKFITHSYPMDIGSLNLWIEFSELGNMVSFIDKDPSKRHEVFFDDATTDHLDTIISALNDIRNMLFQQESEKGEVSE